MSDLFSTDSWLGRLITVSSDFLWTYILIAVLIGCAFWFTLRSRGVQFRMIGEMFRLLGESTGKHDGKKHISSFQAFAVSVATRVGTGNLAGVATAIAVGGPGAVFWMWVIALLGAASAFVESTLAQLFKQREKHHFIGGPAYYILKGLRQPWLAALFAVLISVTFGLSYNSIQSNTICNALNVAFGIDPMVIGLILAAISLLVIFGGIHRIAKVSSVIVPIMALGYLVLALYVIFRHVDLIPQVLRLIFEDAFGIRQIAGGGIGATLMNGIKRGLFSNEAGEGSAPNVAATASTSHPVKQGLIQALGVFTDTLVVCSCTAFIILFSGVDTQGGLNGIALTQAALESEVGRFGTLFVALAILLFAYSSIIGNYYYGATNIRFLTQKKWVMTLYRLFSGGVMVLFGAMASLDLVWNLGDLCMALLTACNLYAIARLSKYAFRLLDDYRTQRKAGRNPVFHRSTTPELDLDCWE
ncbi:MAG: alanine:cation symporter family protein [Bacteroidales bacterium]|nr:alanine:cation symporter family protein [Bacteroidales bacterium]